MATPLKASDAIAQMAEIYQSHLTAVPYPKHHALNAVAEAAADEHQAAIVAWLRNRENQHEVINLTFASTNSDVIMAMAKCADIIESGNWKGQG